MKSFLFWVVTTLLNIGAFILNAVLISAMWTWFLEPYTNIKLPVMHAFGVALMLEFIFMALQTRIEKVHEVLNGDTNVAEFTTNTFEYNFRELTGKLCIFGVAYVVHLLW